MASGQGNGCDPGSDARLSCLLGEFEVLRFILSQFLERCGNVDEGYGSQCSSALGDALLQLLDITKSVNKADRLLIHWHEQSKTARTALGLIGLRKKTQEKIDTKTEQLRVKLFNLETSLMTASAIYQDWSRDIDAVNEEIREFSSSNVGLIVREAQALCKKFQEDCEVAEESIGGFEEIHTLAKGSLAESNKSKLEVENEGASVRKSQKNFSMLGTASFLGCAVVGVGTVFATGGVSVMVMGAGTAWGLLGLGCVAEAKSDKKLGEAKNLSDEETRLGEAVKIANDVVNNLDSRLFDARLKQSEYIEANITAQRIQTDATCLRGEAHRILANLRSASTALGYSEESIRSTANDLQDAGYARSRQEMASRLRKMLGRLVGMDGQQKKIHLDQATVESAFNELQQVDRGTAYALEFTFSRD